MNPDYWLKQTNTPLFPELEWSRPENKKHAGKLLIVGGTAQGFSAPAHAYVEAVKAGAGTVRVLLPEALRKTVGKLFPDAEFAPNTPSGSFGRSATAELHAAAGWADGILLPGEIGRNSETSVLLEDFLEKYGGQVTATKDVADFLCDNPHSVLQRPETLLVLAMGQLRRLGTSAKYSRAFTTDMGLVQLVEALHEFTKRFSLYIVTKHQGHYISAVAGQVSTTKITTDMPIWRAAAATTCAIWWLQNPTIAFKALSTGIYSLK